MVVVLSVVKIHLKLIEVVLTQQDILQKMWFMLDWLKNVKYKLHILSELQTLSHSM